MLTRDLYICCRNGLTESVPKRMKIGLRVALISSRRGFITKLRREHVAFSHLADWQGASRRSRQWPRSLLSPPAPRPGPHGGGPLISWNRDQNFPPPWTVEERPAASRRLGLSRNSRPTSSCCSSQQFRFRLTSWSIGAFATRSDSGSREGNGRWLFIFRTSTCRKRRQLSERGKTRKLQLPQSLMLG